MEMKTDITINHNVCVELNSGIDVTNMQDGNVDTQNAVTIDKHIGNNKLNMDNTVNYNEILELSGFGTLDTNANEDQAEKNKKCEMISDKTNQEYGYDKTLKHDDETAMHHAIIKSYHYNTDIGEQENVRVLHTADANDCTHVKPVNDNTNIPNENIQLVSGEMSICFGTKDELDILNGNVKSDNDKTSVNVVITHSETNFKMMNFFDDKGASSENNGAINNNAVSDVLNQMTDISTNDSEIADPTYMYHITYNDEKENEKLIVDKTDVDDMNVNDTLNKIDKDTEKVQTTTEQAGIKDTNAETNAVSMGTGRENGGTSSDTTISYIAMDIPTNISCTAKVEDVDDKSNVGNVTLEWTDNKYGDRETLNNMEKQESDTNIEKAMYNKDIQLSDDIERIRVLDNVSSTEHTTDEDKCDGSKNITDDVVTETRDKESESKGRNIRSDSQDWFDARKRVYDSIECSVDDTVSGSGIGCRTWSRNCRNEKYTDEQDKTEMGQAATDRCDVISNENATSKTDTDINIKAYAADVPKSRITKDHRDDTEKGMTRQKDISQLREDVLGNLAQLKQALLDVSSRLKDSAEAKKGLTMWGVVGGALAVGGVMASVHTLGASLFLTKIGAGIGIASGLGGSAMYLEGRKGDESIQTVQVAIGEFRKAFTDYIHLANVPGYSYNLNIDEWINKIVSRCLSNAIKDKTNAVTNTDVVDSITDSEHSVHNNEDNERVSANENNIQLNSLPSIADFESSTILTKYGKPNTLPTNTKNCSHLDIDNVTDTQSSQMPENTVLQLEKSITQEVSDNNLESARLGDNDNGLFQYKGRDSDPRTCSLGTGVALTQANAAETQSSNPMLMWSSVYDKVSNIISPSKNTTAPKDDISNSDKSNAPKHAESTTDASPQASCEQEGKFQFVEFLKECIEVQKFNITQTAQLLKTIANLLEECFLTKVDVIEHLYVDQNISYSETVIQCSTEKEKKAHVKLQAEMPYIEYTNAENTDTISDTSIDVNDAESEKNYTISQTNMDVHNVESGPTNDLICCTNMDMGTNESATICPTETEHITMLNNIDCVLFANKNPDGDCVVSLTDTTITEYQDVASVVTTPEDGNCDMCDAEDPPGSLNNNQLQIKTTNLKPYLDIDDSNESVSQNLKCAQHGSDANVTDDKPCTAQNERSISEINVKNEDENIQYLADQGMSLKSEHEAVLGTVLNIEPDYEKGTDNQNSSIADTGTELTPTTEQESVNCFTENEQNLHNLEVDLYEKFTKAKASVEEVANILTDKDVSVQMTKTGLTATAALGGALAVAGVLGSFYTMGASLVLTKIGAGIGVASGAGTGATYIIDKMLQDDNFEKTQGPIADFNMTYKEYMSAKLISENENLMIPSDNTCEVADKETLENINEGDSSSLERLKSEGDSANLDSENVDTVNRFNIFSMSDGITLDITQFVCRCVKDENMSLSETANLLRHKLEEVDNKLIWEIWRGASRCADDDNTDQQNCDEICEDEPDDENLLIDLRVPDPSDKQGILDSDENFLIDLRVPDLSDKQDMLASGNDKPEWMHLSNWDNLLQPFNSDNSLDKSKNSTSDGLNGLVDEDTLAYNVVNKTMLLSPDCNSLIDNSVDLVKPKGGTTDNLIDLDNVISYENNLPEKSLDNVLTTVPSILSQDITGLTQKPKHISITGAGDIQTNDKVADPSLQLTDSAFVNELFSPNSDEGLSTSEYGMAIGIGSNDVMKMSIVNDKPDLMHMDDLDHKLAPFITDNLLDKSKESGSDDVNSLAYPDTSATYGCGKHKLLSQDGHSLIDDSVDLVRPKERIVDNLIELECVMSDENTSSENVHTEVSSTLSDDVIEPIPTCEYRSYTKADDAQINNKAADPALKLTDSAFVNELFFPNSEEGLSASEYGMAIGIGINDTMEMSIGKLSLNEEDLMSNSVHYTDETTAMDTNRHDNKPLSLTKEELVNENDQDMERNVSCDIDLQLSTYSITDSQTFLVKDNDIHKDEEKGVLDSANRILAHSPKLTLTARDLNLNDITTHKSTNNNKTKPKEETLILDNDNIVNEDTLSMSDTEIQGMHVEYLTNKADVRLKTNNNVHVIDSLALPNTRKVQCDEEVLSLNLVNDHLSDHGSMSTSSIESGEQQDKPRQSGDALNAQANKVEDLQSSLEGKVLACYMGEPDDMKSNLLHKLNRAVRILLDVATFLDEQHKGAEMKRKGFTASGIVGGAMVAGGIVGSVFTMGSSLVLTKVGAGIVLASGAGGTVTALYDNIIGDTRVKEAQIVIDNFNTALAQYEDTRNSEDKSQTPTAAFTKAQTDSSGEFALSDRNRHTRDTESVMLQRFGIHISLNEFVLDFLNTKSLEEAAQFLRKKVQEIEKHKRILENSLD